MWFDVNTALVQALERHPEEAVPTLPERQRVPLEGVLQSDLIVGTPNAIANVILGRLRKCETLAQASIVLTHCQAEIADLERTAPVRKTHIENYIRYMWANRSKLHEMQKKEGSK